jgi:hypothetical protein
MPFLLLAVLGAVGLAITPGLLWESGVLSSAPGLLPAAWGTLSAIALGGIVGAPLAASGRWSLALKVLVAASLVFGVFAWSGPGRGR